MKRGGRLALYALTPQGAELLRRLAPALPGCEIFLPARLARPGEHGFDRLAPALAENFARYAGHVLVAATGIVVRAIAPLINAKDLDPAVVVLDGRGRFAVSLLSGHLGGANELARRVAHILGGQAVITTATDTESLPSLEMVAAELGLKVENLPALAGLSAALLEGRTVPVWDPGEWLWPRLEGSWPGLFTRLEQPPALDTPGPLAWLDWRDAATAPGWLVLRPPCLVLGLGCNRGTEKDELAALATSALDQAGLARGSLAFLASVTVKAGEAGLLALADEWRLETIFYSPQDLDGVEAPSPSPVVRGHLGTGSVCEAAAMLAAQGGPLLLKKIKNKNATAALALKAGSR